MFYQHTARVAPEKTESSACPAAMLLAESFGENKMALTYFEQLKHPNWQRRRLDMLNEANFECSDCGSKETTLHVHHKQYFKGRMAWEYSNEELVVLCEGCHKSEHRSADVMKQIMVVENTFQMLAIMGGFLHRSEKQDPGLIEEARQGYPLGFAYGYVASLLEFLEIDEIAKVAEYAVSLTHAKSEARPIFEANKTYIGIPD